MADSQDESDSVTDPIDDGQLTIRIPNPKVYMARQSQWIGRRGKPRCDHCRLNNLKCDRVLPTCNHCSWAFGRDCKYTPLPTPAHRGIPRCDRCRLKNLKCDRNLPVCNHCSVEAETECNYTPKKRHKVPTEHGVVKESQIGPYGAKAASFLVSDVMNTEDQDVEGSNGNDDYADQRHSFYGQNIASTSSSRQPTDARERGGSMESRFNRVPSNYQNKFTPQHPGRVVVMQNSPLPAVVSKTPPPANQISFISHTFPSNNGIMVSQCPVDPWVHPTFHPLPDVVGRRLVNMDSVEMPDRESYNRALDQFFASLGTELRETAAFTPDMYMLIHRSIVSGDMERLSSRLRMWLSIHHACSGSNKQCLLLLPSDEYFNMDATEEERMRQLYVLRTDRTIGFGDQSALHVRSKSRTHSRSHSHDNDSTQLDSDFFDHNLVFERIPVQPQIFDIMCYAHDKHVVSYDMMFEIRKLGMATLTWPMAEMFVNLCPTCNVTKKLATSSHGGKAETSSSSSSGMKT